VKFKFFDAQITGFLSSIGARIVLLPVTGLLSVLTARMVTEGYGVDGFGVFSIALGIPMILQAADIGLSAVVINIAPRFQTDFKHYLATLQRVFRYLCACAFILTIVALSLGLKGDLSSLLGMNEFNVSNFAIFISIMLFAFSLPGRLGTGILIGSGKNYLVVMLQSLTSLSTFLAAFLVLNAGLGINVLIALSSFGIFISSNISFLFVRKGIVGILSCSSRRIELWDTALPFMTLVIFLQLFSHSPRFILAHTTSYKDVAMYSLIYSIYNPLISIIQSSGFASWGDFSKSRALRTNVKQILVRGILLNFILGSLLCLFFYFASPFILEYILGSLSVSGRLTVLLFSIMIFLAAMSNTSSMFLTNPQGLRFQTKITALAVLIFLPVGFYASKSSGINGIVISQLIIQLFTITLPTLRKSFGGIKEVS